MIFRKIWRAFKAQVNKVGNALFRADPMAQLQYEYDALVDQLKEGRVGLEQYRGLVERVGRQVQNNNANVATLEAKIKAYLAADDRESAGRLALQLQKARKELQENEAQLAMHERAYTNNLAKIKHANGKLTELRTRIQKYDADLKMSRAEAELAKVAREFNVDITTDFGEIEQVIQDEIDRNRGAAKVAADLSGEGLEQVQHEIEVEKRLADNALREFEQQMGLPAPQPRMLESKP
jgi:phage shock protein A